MDYRCALHTPVVDDEPVIVEISKGDSFNRITAKLAEQGLAIRPFWFRVLALQNGAFKKIKTGEYLLQTGLTLADILTLLVQGKTRQYSITFPEGWNVRQVLQKIAGNPHLNHELSSTDLATLSSTLGMNGLLPEGEFFPDTYFFDKHTSDIALLKRAHARMQTLLEQEWQNRDDNLPLRSQYEALILASIVEKETASGAERPQIAGVFTRRLQQNMPLQTDPTVIYGMGAQYTGNITSKDLVTATAYNTYLFKGLPPTPIAMPGHDAIKAVLHPAAGDSLYFVARGDGTHVFSATLDAHNAAVDRYQRHKK